MKINLFALILFIFSGLGCNSLSSNQKTSFIHDVLDSLKIDRSKNIIIYTINPNDCINCLIGFTHINDSLSRISNPELYVLSVEREIEKDQLLKTMTTIDLSNTANRSVLWDKNIFTGINRSANKNLPISLLTIYNFQKDSILFSKPIKEIIGLDSVSRYLGK